MATGKGKTQVDWVKARNWYMEDVTRSYVDVAKQFGVTKKSVEQQASKPGQDSWLTTRQRLGEMAAAKHDAQHVNNLAKTNDRHLAYYRNMQTVGNNLLVKLSDMLNPSDTSKGKMPDARQINAAATTLKMGIEGERVILGLPIIIAKSDTAIEDKRQPTPAEAINDLHKVQDRIKRLEQYAAEQPTDTASDS